MAKTKDVLIYLFLRHLPFRIFTFVLASTNIYTWVDPKNVNTLVVASSLPYYLVVTLRLEGPIWSFVASILMVFVITPTLMSFVPAWIIVPIGLCVWQLGSLLVPIGFGMELLWETYSDSSATTRQRRARREAEKAFDRANPKEKASRAVGKKFWGLILMALLLLLVFDRLHRVPYGSLGVAGVLLIPITVYRLYMTLHSVYCRYVEKRLVSWGLVRPLTPVLSPLPLELWEKIIDFALDVPEYFASDCEIGDLPDFLSYRRVRISPPQTWDPYFQSVQLRHNLGLVSRTWKTIVDRQASHWYTLSPYLYHVPKVSRLNNPRRVDFYPPRDEYYLKYRTKDPLPLGAPSSWKATWIKPAVVTVKAGPYGHFFEQYTLFPHLQSSPDTWGAVECLAYQSQSMMVGLVPKFCTVFPFLRTLILNGTTILMNSNVVFPHLHTLELVAGQSDFSNWSFPQLRRLSLLNAHLPVEYRTNTESDSTVPLHLNNLEGLLLHLQTVVLDSAFWVRHPSLRMLGCVEFVLFDPPPPNHPIQYLYISRDDIYSHSPERYSNLLGLLEGERATRKQKKKRILYLRPPSSSIRSSPHIASWRRFFAESQVEGIKWKPIWHQVDPEYTWMPLLPSENRIEAVERVLVDWALEICFAISIAIQYCLFSPSPSIRSDMGVALVLGLWLYLFVRESALSS